MGWRMRHAEAARPTLVMFEDPVCQRPTCAPMQTCIRKIDTTNHRKLLQILSISKSGSQIWSFLGHTPLNSQPKYINGGQHLVRNNRGPCGRAPMVSLGCGHAPVSFFGHVKSPNAPHRTHVPILEGRREVLDCGGPVSA